MKKSRFSRIKRGVVAFLVCVVFSALGNANDVQEKVMLMLDAVKAKDSGNFIEAKLKLEEILKISPNDTFVQGLLISVNDSIAIDAKKNQHSQQGKDGGYIAPF